MTKLLLAALLSIACLHCAAAGEDETEAADETADQPETKVAVEVDTATPARKAGKGQQEYLVVTLNEVLVTSY